MVGWTLPPLKAVAAAPEADVTPKSPPENTASVELRRPSMQRRPHVPPAAGCDWPTAHSWLLETLNQLQRSEIDAYLRRDDRCRDACKSERSFLRAFWEKESRDPERARACVASFLLLERLREALLKRLRGCGSSVDGSAAVGRREQRRHDRKRFDPLLRTALKGVNPKGASNARQASHHSESVEYAELVAEVAHTMLDEKRRRQRERDATGRRQGVNGQESGAGATRTGGEAEEGSALGSAASEARPADDPGSLLFYT